MAEKFSVVFLTICLLAVTVSALPAYSEDTNLGDTVNFPQTAGMLFLYVDNIFCLPTSSLFMSDS
jgi:hypothetical protein